MNIHMARTTLVIDDHRMVELKKLAAARRQTLSAVVDEFLREGLERTKSPRKHKAQTLPKPFPMGRELVDISDRDRLYVAQHATRGHSGRARGQRRSESHFAPRVAAKS